MVLVEFDYLVTKDKIEEGENFKDFLNPVVSVGSALTTNILRVEVMSRTFVSDERGCRFVSHLRTNVSGLQNVTHIVFSFLTSSVVSSA